MNYNSTLRNGQQTTINALHRHGCPRQGFILAIRDDGSGNGSVLRGKPEYSTQDK